MSELASNLARVEEAISAACRAAERRREEVELVAVSKVHPTAARKHYGLSTLDIQFV